MQMRCRFATGGVPKGACPPESSRAGLPAEQSEKGKGRDQPTKQTNKEKKRKIVCDQAMRITRGDNDEDDDSDAAACQTFAHSPVSQRTPWFAD